MEGSSSLTDTRTMELLSLIRGLFRRSKRQDTETDPRLFSSPVLDRAFSMQNYVLCLQMLDSNVKEGFYYRDSFGNSILHTAAMKRSPLCGLLVDLGMSPNARNEYHETALHISLSGTFRCTVPPDQVERIRTLELKTPVVLQAREMLLSHAGIEITGHDIAVLLLGRGADPNAGLIDDKTPLITAVRYMTPLTTIALLMRYGADARLKDFSRKDAIEWARHVGDDLSAEYMTWVIVSVTLLVAHRTDASLPKPEGLLSLPQELIRVICEFSMPRIPPWRDRLLERGTT